MNRMIGSVAAFAAVLACSTPALAHAKKAMHHRTAMQSDMTSKAEIVKRGPGGRAEVVRIDGQEYNVCTAQVQDSCINPRQAGLNWGNNELGYWPGKPASEVAGPLPANNPR